jgi:sugar O-acyltransferase (sialic acid O-acetyltransferase NeuD family)
MKNLLIIGARGFGREIYNLALSCKGFGSEFNVKGFLDDKPGALDGLTGYPQILGPVETYKVQDDDVFVCALGLPKSKKHYVDIILEKRGMFYTLIHPTAIISQNTVIDQGAVIQANAFVSSEVQIGAFVALQPFCVIGHDAQIGSFSHLNAYAFMGGYANCGVGVTLHTGSKVLPHKSVGDWATVGAGSIVMRNVKPDMTVFGMPALPI